MATTRESPAGTLGGYTPLVPTFSPYTASAEAAIRLAWRVTFVAAAALVLLAIGGPLLYRWYVTSAIEPQPAPVTSIDGIVFLRHNGLRDWSVAAPDMAIAPGDTIRTAVNARAFVVLPDQSTILLYPSSTLRLLRAEQGRFQRERTTVVVELQGGRARIGVAPPADPEAAFFQLRMPNAEVHLEEGSYSADVSREASQVRVRLGEATAHAAGGIVSARAGQRLVVRADRPPLGHQPMRADLLENGWFTDRGERSIGAWVQLDLSEQEPPGAISLVDVPGALSFSRSGRGHGETLIQQQLDADLWDYEKLVLSADVRVLSHSLSGGGWQGTEYPLMLRVHYRDSTGGVRPWFVGFYLHNDENYPVLNAIRLPSTDWQRVEIDLFSVVPRPWRIERVEVVATGWDYHSAVREVHVWAE